jgi:hypothetical protein
MVYSECADTATEQVIGLHLLMKREKVNGPACEPARLRKSLHEPYSKVEAPLTIQVNFEPFPTTIQ